MFEVSAMLFITNNYIGKVNVVCHNKILVFMSLHEVLCYDTGSSLRIQRRK